MCVAAFVPCRRHWLFWSVRPAGGQCPSDPGLELQLLQLRASDVTASVGGGVGGGNGYGGAADVRWAFPSGFRTDETSKRIRVLGRPEFDQSRQVPTYGSSGGTRRARASAITSLRVERRYELGPDRPEDTA